MQACLWATFGTLTLLTLACTAFLLGCTSKVWINPRPWISPRFGELLSRFGNLPPKFGILLPRFDELPPSFLYLIQTESCLYPHYMTPQFFAKSTLCSCNVLVLSYKKPCSNNLSSHIQYVYRPGSSWSAGRNMLHQLSQARNVEYTYYIFMDDDLEMSYSKFAPDRNTTVPPLRAFEDFLLEYLPAIGVGNYEQNHGATEVLGIRKRVCEDLSYDVVSRSRAYTPKPLYLPHVNFDPCFNAVHRDAVNYMLPYTTRYDNTSWWSSGRCFAVTAELVFRGQAYMYLPLHIKNPVHRPYPRWERSVHQIFEKCIDDTARKIPNASRQNDFVAAFRKRPHHHLANTISYCLKYPARHPIIPYSHFALNLTV